MRVAKQARRCLQNQWKNAVAVQLIGAAAGILLLGVEFLAAWLAGVPFFEILHAANWAADPRLWLHALLIMAMALTDLLALSPLYLGQFAYYYELARATEKAGAATCSFQPIRHVPVDASLSKTHEFVAVKEKKRTEPVPTHIIWRYYRRGYWRAVGWRAQMWAWQVVFGLACYTPAALLWGYAEVLAAGEATSIEAITRLFCGLFGLFALCAGWVVQQLLLLRFFPAPFLLAKGLPLREAMRRSRRIMKGQIGWTAGSYLGFAGWFASCILLVPYLYAIPLFRTSQAVAFRRLLAPEGNRKPRIWLQIPAAPSRLRRGPAV